jgi:hypothetical protein
MWSFYHPNESSNHSFSTYVYLPSSSTYPRCCAAYSRVFPSIGHPFSRAHRSASRCPPFAAHSHVLLSHGQPFARSHFNTSRCPRADACAHVRAFHDAPFARAHRSTSSCPHLAAVEQRMCVQIRRPRDTDASACPSTRAPRLSTCSSHVPGALSPSLRRASRDSPPGYARGQWDKGECADRGSEPKRPGEGWQSLCASRTVAFWSREMRALCLARSW